MSKVTLEEVGKLSFYNIMIIMIIFSILFVGISLSFSSAAPSVSPQNNCDGILRIYGRCESGSTSCTIIATTTSCLPNVSPCFAAIGCLYPVAFTNIPTRYANISTITGFFGNVMVISNPQVDFFALTSVGQVWANMPAAVTEIFGDNGQHWKGVDWTGVDNVAFAVNCITGSASLTAILQLQYSIDGGATFNNIAASINIQAAVCPNGGVTSGSPTAYVSVPVNAQVNNVILRVVGQFGNGIGDNPAFTQAYVLEKKSNLTADVCSWRDLTPNVNALTRIKIEIDCSVAPPTGQTSVITISWFAFSAKG